MTPIQQPDLISQTFFNDHAFQELDFIALVKNSPIIQGSGTGGESFGS